PLHDHVDLTVGGTAVGTDIDLTTFAAGIGGGNSGAGVGGSASVNVIIMNTTASVGTGSTLTGTTGVTVKAEDTLPVFSAAGGIGASASSAGVGIGLDVDVITRHTKAFVKKGAHLSSASGDVDIDAESKDDITSVAATFGLSTGSAAVAGSIGVAVVI